MEGRIGLGGCVDVELRSYNMYKGEGVGLKMIFTFWFGWEIIRYIG